MLDHLENLSISDLTHKWNVNRTIAHRLFASIWSIDACTNPKTTDRGSNASPSNRPTLIHSHTHAQHFLIYGIFISWNEEKEHRLRRRRRRRHLNSRNDRTETVCFFGKAPHAIEMAKPTVIYDKFISMKWDPCSFRGIFGGERSVCVDDNFCNGRCGNQFKWFGQAHDFNIKCI